MRNLIVIALLASATSVAAQPITSPTPCKVTISRAPDNVREVVEAWVKAEPRCASAIDVRIIPTTEGLYLLAQDDRGHVRERIVPDAQSAGVLIASWVADDTFPSDLTVVFVPHSAPAALARAPEGALVDQALQRRGDEGRLSKWLSVGLTFNVGQDHARGLRAEADILSWTSWSVGVAASRTALSVYDGERPDGFAYLQETETKAIGYVVRTVRTGHLLLRAQLGAGAVWGDAVAAVPMTTGAGQYITGQSDTFAVGEGALIAAVQLGNWGLHAGPVVTAYSHRLLEEAVAREKVEMLLWTGIRRAL
jgi:hypothetical protein